MKRKTLGLLVLCGSLFLGVSCIPNVGNIFDIQGLFNNLTGN